MGPPESPQQNSVVERFNRTLADRLRSMLIHANLPSYLWGEVLMSVCHILNMCTSKAIHERCPELSWQKLALKIQKPAVDYNRLRAVGCLAFNIPPGHKNKLQPRSMRSVMIGYEPKSNAYRLWDPKSRRMMVSNDVVFDEWKFPLHDSTLDDPAEQSVFTNTSWDEIWDIPSANTRLTNPNPALEPAPPPSNNTPSKTSCPSS